MSSVLYDAPGPKARARSRVISVVGVVVLLGVLAWLIFALGAPKASANGVVQPGMWDGTRWDVFSDRQVWLALGRGVLATLKMAAVAFFYLIITITLGQIAARVEKKVAVLR